MIINYDDILKKLDSELDILEIEEADSNEDLSSKVNINFEPQNSQK